MPDATHPSPSPHPYQHASPAEAPPLPTQPFGSPSTAWAQVPYIAPPPPPSPRRPRGWLFYAIWVAVGILAIGLLLQAVAFAVSAVADIAEASNSLSDPTGTVLSESWDVDGVDVVYVEGGGTPCETEYCWEWLLMTQPECAAPTVTVEIGDTMYGETQRWVELSITTENVTSVVVEAAEGDGDYADLTAITCK